MKIRNLQTVLMVGAIAIIIPGVTAGVILKRDKTPAVIALHTEISEESSKVLQSEINEAKDKGAKRVLVDINSPGGEVFGGKIGASVIFNDDRVDTYVSGVAASMAAQTFMAGNRRFMEKDAVILFHGAHSGSAMSTQVGIEKLLKILESDDFKNLIKDEIQGNKEKDITKEQTSDAMMRLMESISKGTKPMEKVVGDPMDYAYVVLLKKAVLDGGYFDVKTELVNALALLKTINVTGAVVFDKIIERSNGRWTRERVIKEIYGNFEKDMVFTGEQMFEMGLIDGLGRPPVEDYMP